MDYKKALSEHLEINGLSKEEIYCLIAPTLNIKMGDFSLPCFSFAKLSKTSPNIIAQNIANSTPKTDWLQKIEALGGYVNFFLNRDKVSQEVLKEVIEKDKLFAISNEGEGKTIVMDYSSVNIAKQMHIGHLLTTAIGNSLNLIYKSLGYKTVGLNYLGDYGIPFGEIIAAHKAFGSEEELLEGGIDYIQKMYSKSKEQTKLDEDFAKSGMEWFAKIEQKDGEALRLFEIFKKLTLQDVMPIFELANITFDEWKGELYYSDKMEPVIKELKEKNLLQESMGRLIVDLQEDNLNVAIIIKEDGSTRYITRDLAAAIDRYKTYKFEKCLYVTGYEQNLHFAQFFKILEKMGYEFAKNLVHVFYGRVRLPEGKLSSRAGAKALLKDIFSTAIQRASEIIELKNPDLLNKQEVAKVVGVGAVMYGALANQKIKDSIFNLEDALSFEGETAPYMQYTYARCSSVLRKFKDLDVPQNMASDYGAISSDEAFEIIKTLQNFKEIVREAAYKYEPSIISKAVMSIAKNFNKFYHDKKIVEGATPTTLARIELVKATRIALKVGLGLLGLGTVEEM